MGDVRGNKIHQHISSHTRLDSCISEVEGFIEQSNMKDEELSKRIHQTLSIGLNNIWLWSGHPFSEVFVQCNRNYGLQAAEAFIKTVTQKQIEPYFLDYVRNDANSFFGFVLACEFLRKDVDVFKRRNAEKASLDRLRRQYEQIKGELVEDFEGFKSEFDAWGDATRQKWDDLLDRSSKAHSDQQKSHGEAFEKLLKDSESNLGDLIKKYEEDLRYSPSVEHWQNAAKKYEAEGNRWVRWLMGSLSVGVLAFLIFFIIWLKGHATGIQLDTVQGI